MSLQDDVNGFWSRVRRAREAVGRVDAERLFLKNMSLGDQIGNMTDDPSRELLGGPFNEGSMVQATLAAETALSAAAKNAEIIREEHDKAGGGHSGSHTESAVES